MIICWEIARKEIKFKDTKGKWFLDKVTKKKKEDKFERNILKQEGYGKEKTKDKDGGYCGLSCDPKKYIFKS